MRKDKTTTTADYDISHPHDKMFQKAMHEPKAARSLIENHVPEEIKNLIDMSTLKVEKDSFIDDDFKKYACDVLFSAKFGNRDGYLFFLLEHQSKPDYWMAFRLMRYMINICSAYLKQHKNAGHLPLIYPVVIYNGLEKYTAPLNFWDLFEESDKAKKIWTEDHQLINVHDIPDEKFTAMGWSGALEFCLKHRSDKNMIKTLEQAQELELIPDILKSGDDGIRYFQNLLFYLLTGIDKNDKMKVEEIIAANLNQEQGEKFMTSLAKHWLDEGIEKGMAKGILRGKAEGIKEGILKGKTEGIEQTAINMLRQGLDPKLIFSVTGLTLHEIQKLKSKL